LVIFFSSANVKIREPRSCGTLVLVLFISKEAAYMVVLPQSVISTQIRQS
jgi:hypothetical protein